MRPCEKCLENNWEIKFIDGFIRATCRLCGHEVEFKARTGGHEDHREYQEGDPCRKCGVSVRVKASKWKEEKRRKPFYYTHIIQCPSCRTIYLQERFKVHNPPRPVENSLLTD